MPDTNTEATLPNSEVVALTLEFVEWLEVARVQSMKGHWRNVRSIIDVELMPRVVAGQARFDLAMEVQRFEHAD